MRFDLGTSASLTILREGQYDHRPDRLLDLGFVSVSTLLAFVLGTVIGALVGWSKTSKYLSWLMPPPGDVLGYPCCGIHPGFGAHLSAGVQGQEHSPHAAAIPRRWQGPGPSPRYWLDVAHHRGAPGSGDVADIDRWVVTVDAGDDGHRGGRPDYMTFQRAKGLKEKGSQLFFRYAHNALTAPGDGAGDAVGADRIGATLVEGMFSYPGIGNRLGGDQALDYP